MITRTTESGEALVLSHTQLSMFRECAYKWHLIYDLKTARMPSGPLILGDALHRAFAVALAPLKDGATALPALDDVLFEASSVFYARQGEEDPLSEVIPMADLEILDKRLAAAVRAFHDFISAQLMNAHRKRAPFRVRMVEQPFTISHPYDETIVLRGTIDLVTEPADGYYVGIDWKSGRTFTQEAATKSPQAETYLVGASRMAAAGVEGWHQLRRFSFVAFPYDPQADVCTVQLYPAERNTKQIARFLADVSDGAKAIRASAANAHYVAAPGKQCARCDVLHACEFGQAWLQAQHVTPRVPVTAPPSPAVSANESEHD